MLRPLGGKDLRHGGAQCPARPERERRRGGLGQDGLNLFRGADRDIRDPGSGAGDHVAKRQAEPVDQPLREFGVLRGPAIEAEFHQPGGPGQGDEPLRPLARGRSVGRRSRPGSFRPRNRATRRGPPDPAVAGCDPARARRGDARWLRSASVEAGVGLWQGRSDAGRRLCRGRARRLGVAPCAVNAAAGQAGARASASTDSGYFRTMTWVTPARGHVGLAERSRLQASDRRRPASKPANKGA